MTPQHATPQLLSSSASSSAAAAAAYPSKAAFALPHADSSSQAPIAAFTHTHSQLRQASQTPVARCITPQVLPAACYIPCASLMQLFVQSSTPNEDQ